MATQIVYDDATVGGKLMDLLINLLIMLFFAIVALYVIKLALPLINVPPEIGNVLLKILGLIFLLYLVLMLFGLTSGPTLWRG